MEARHDLHRNLCPAERDLRTDKPIPWKDRLYLDGIRARQSRSSKGGLNVDAKAINQHDLNNLSSPLLQIVADYFKLPGVQEKYAIWLENRRREEASNG